MRFLTRAYDHLSRMLLAEDSKKQEIAELLSKKSDPSVYKLKMRTRLPYVRVHTVAKIKKLTAQERADRELLKPGALARRTPAGRIASFFGLADTFERYKAQEYDPAGAARRTRALKGETALLQAQDVYLYTRLTHIDR